MDLFNPKARHIVLHHLNEVVIVFAHTVHLPLK